MGFGKYNRSERQIANEIKAINDRQHKLYNSYKDLDIQKNLRIRQLNGKYQEHRYKMPQLQAGPTSPAGNNEGQ